MAVHRARGAERAAPAREPATRIVRGGGRAEDPVYALGRDLGLTVVPRSLACIDISHNQGRDIVGSLVWFEAGRPKKAEYRRFRIKGLAQQDDFAAIHEVVTRYLTRRRDENLPLP
jgi:excinuclease ABC subunit C